MSNVVYKFTGLRDADLSYIGTTSRRSVTRAQEHLYLITDKTAILQHSLLAYAHLVTAVNWALAAS